MEFFSPNERCYVPWLICYWFATGAAAVLLWLTLAIPPTALVGAFLAGRIGHRTTAGIGFGLVATALFLMGGWPPTIEVRDMAPTLILAGLSRFDWL